jgi:hypothetical protein
MYVRSYKELTVWQKSMDLVEEIYKITKSLPKAEAYGLSLQMQRAAISIPSNIAEVREVVKNLFKSKHPEGRKIIERNFENVVRYAPKDEIKF